MSTICVFRMAVVMRVLLLLGNDGIERKSGDSCSRSRLMNGSFAPAGIDMALKENRTPIPQD